MTSRWEAMFRHGLFYMDMHPPTDKELHDYLHVFLTTDSAWNPDYMDGEFPCNLNSDIILSDDELLQNLRNTCDPHVNVDLQYGPHSSEELFHDNYKHTKMYTVSHLD